MVAIEKIIDSKSGHPLPLQIRIPGLKPKVVIVINTGTCIPQRIYWRFADFLAENGYITITYDYTDAQNFASGVSHTVWLKDMESVLDFVLSEYAGLRKIVVGHSSGGQLLGMLPNASQMDRLFLVASANGYWKLMDGFSKYAMWFFWKVIAPLNIRIFGYFNNRMFGSGGGFPKNIILELRSFCQQEAFFFPYFERNQIKPHYREIRTKITAYHLEGDVIANERACRYIADLYEHAELDFKSLKASDYGMKRFGHRSFFSATSQKLWNEFLMELETTVCLPTGEKP